MDKNLNYPYYLICNNYAPMVKDGTCRLCWKNSTEHRKLYIYSFYARNIQLWWFRTRINKYAKQWFHKVVLYKYYWKGRSSKNLQNTGFTQLSYTSITGKVDVIPSII